MDRSTPLSALSCAFALASALVFFAPAAVAQPVPCTTSPECNDLDPCNGVETCVSGFCQAGTPVDCSDGDPCTADHCFPEGSGKCFHPEIQYCRCTADEDCVDASFCTVEGACVDGACTPPRAERDCNDGDACTADSCTENDPADPCKNQPVPGCLACSTNAECDDSDVCSTESCVDGFCRWDPLSASTPCTDASGSWQLTRSTCDNRGQLRLDPRRASATFWNVEQQINGSLALTADPLCGSIVYLNHLHKVSQCSVAPDPLDGMLQGGLMATPNSGCQTWNSELEIPIDAPCDQGGADIARMSVPDAFRVMASDDGTGMAARLHSSNRIAIPACATACAQSWDGDDVPCMCFATERQYQCEEWRRNDVATGTNVTVRPFPGGSITFDNVVSPGVAGVIVVSHGAAAADPGYESLVPLYFDIVTSATITGTILTCLPYTDEDDDGYVDGTAVNEGGVRLLHEEAGVFIDRTESVDTATNTVCARTSTLSQHVLARAADLCGNGLLDLGESCDDGDTASGDGCRADCAMEGCFNCSGEPSVCSTAPRTGCRTSVDASKSSVMLVNGSPDSRDRAQWKWMKGRETAYTDYADPTVAGDISLCAWEGAGGSLLLSATAPGGVTCNGKPCWKAQGKTPVGENGYKYGDGKHEHGAVSKVALKPGTRTKAKAVISAGGDTLGIRSPLNVQLPLKVQMHASNGKCWEAVYDAAGVKKTDGSVFKAVGGP